MTKHITSLLAPLAITACATGNSTAVEQQAIAKDACPSNVPAALAPAADQDLSFTLDATGVQIYTCAATATGGYAWTFVAPDAQLFLANNDHESVGHHYVGPTWEYEDGSYVVGRKIAAASVDITSIPWLLLVAASHGGTSDGRMSDVTSIQRLVTSGGNAPADGCDAAHVGAEADVLYTASYFFYVTRDPSKPNNLRCGA
jgi:hypothetical protein